MFFRQLYTYFNVDYIVKGLFSLKYSLFLTLFLIVDSYTVAMSADNTSNADWHYAEQGIMGTIVTVKLQYPDKNIARKISKEIFSLMWDINNEMSNYKDDSLLSKINHAAHKHPVKITDRLYRIIDRSLYFSELSGGAFDITVGTVGKYYDFRKKKKPDSETITKNLANISYKNIKLNKNNKTIYISNQYANIDLGGIAKGYAIEQALKVLERYKIKNAYISAGGDSYALGNKNNRPWFIAIKDPRGKNNNLIIPVTNIAISTSGDYERYFIEDDTRYHHIINPKTGLSAKKSVSVTVIGKSPLDTDALSTTLFVLGEKKGIALINKIKGYDAIFVYPSGKVTYSNGLKREIN